jgi:hypothetical protein
MKSLIRKAAIPDAESIVEIKNLLPFTGVDGTTSTGGFLLGTDAATYRHYIENAFCLVAEVDDKVVGFGIIFTYDMLRQSDVWQRRQLANWNIDLTQYEEKKLGYFEQLAALPGYRKLIVRLAYNLALWVFDSGYDALFTTTVKEPIVNLAAIPFILAVKGIKAGNIDEVYPMIGPIKSDIYLIEYEMFYAESKAHRLFPFLKQHTISLI